jgi:hypothetical protein
MQIPTTHYEGETRSAIFQDPVHIVLEVLGRICLEIERIEAIRRASRGLGVDDRFRATILLYREARKDFVITPLRMVLGAPGGPSRIRAAPMRGLLKQVWLSARARARSATAISLPKWNPHDLASKEEYLEAWARWGVPPNIADQFTRKGRFYMYVPLLKSSRRIGILVIDANIPIQSKRDFSQVVDIVSRHIDHLESCFREDLAIADA